MSPMTPPFVEPPFAEPPFVPAVRDVQVRSGEGWAPRGGTRVGVLGRDFARLEGTARTLARDLERVGHLPGPPPVVPLGSRAEARPGDVLLRLDGVAGAPSGEQEAYRLEFAEPVAVLAGHTERAVHQAGRTLLQALATTGRFGAYEVTDWPSYAVRGLMVDVGRKRFSVHWLERLVERLSALKLNELHLHLSDSLAFRVESETHPEIVAEEAYTRAELCGLAELAARHHIALVPEFDTPGHLRSVLDRHPEHRLRLADGSVRGENLDYSLPAARALVHDLLHEYAELMPGELFHLGGDEYFGYFWEPGHRVTPERAPQLVRFARERGGETLHDGFAAYVNELAGVLREHGKRARVWNDEILPTGGAVRLDGDVQLDTWIRWNHEQPSAADCLRAGYDVVNGHGDHLYYVLGEDRPPRGKKSAPGLYEAWTPRTVMDAPGEDAELTPDERDDRPGRLLGSHLSIWCDTPDLATEDEIADDTAPWLRAFAERLWSAPGPEPDHAAFERRYALLAPGGAANGRT
ncbi:family 20 glycosylhydrolase [Streptomyces sp. NPDC048172]|uniref:family 20 glycosylhydrolase n=1 Tax=Streptomyces sp. NPDC048172 TaxID=3365505 RepID=UPI003717ADC2